MSLQVAGPLFNSHLMSLFQAPTAMGAVFRTPKVSMLFKELVDEYGSITFLYVMLEKLEMYFVLLTSYFMFE